MDNIFYFSRHKVLPSDIIEVAVEFGYQTEYLEPATKLAFHIIYNTEEIFWTCFELSEESGDFEDFASTEKRTISDYNPVVAYHFSYSHTSWAILKNFLKRTFETFGGWAGSDINDNFVPILNLSNIDNVTPPFWHTTQSTTRCYFVIQIEGKHPPDLSEHQYEIQILDKQGRGKLFGHIGALETELTIDNLIVPVAVIEAAKRQSEGKGDYVNDRGQSIHPFTRVPTEL